MFSRQFYSSDKIQIKIRLQLLMISLDSKAKLIKNQKKW